MNHILLSLALINIDVFSDIKHYDMDVKIF